MERLSALGLAHLGDGVYELMVRSWLCLHGKATNAGLHKAAVKYVAAPAQAKLARAILPLGEGRLLRQPPSVRRKRLCLFRREKLRPHVRTRCPPGAANSQTYARGLYENAGFVQSSEEFLEDGIPHIQMVWRKP